MKFKISIRILDESYIETNDYHMNNDGNLFYNFTTLVFERCP